MSVSGLVKHEHGVVNLQHTRAAVELAESSSAEALASPAAASASQSSLKIYRRCFLLIPSFCLHSFALRQVRSRRVGSWPPPPSGRGLEGRKCGRGGAESGRESVNKR